LTVGRDLHHVGGGHGRVPASRPSSVSFEVVVGPLLVPRIQTEAI
jgi:hypothetical protein